MNRILTDLRFNAGSSPCHSSPDRTEEQDHSVSTVREVAWCLSQPGGSRSFASGWRVEEG